MDRLCTRCVHLSRYAERSVGYKIRLIPHKSFSTAIQARAEESSKPSQPPSEDTVRPNLIRRTSDYSGRSQQINAPPSNGQVLRRTGPPRNNASPPGDLNRRTGPPSQPGQVLRRTGPPRQGANSRPAGRNQGPPGKKRTRRTAESVKARESEDELPTSEVLDEHMNRYIDPPANPTEQIEYKPRPQQLTDLNKDWPNTPLSTKGLSASAIQKVEWLARRLPHGYKTPGQLAAHFQKGNLTRFESEEEKTEVLKIAAELANQRAAQLSERKGEEVQAEDMAFSNLSAKDDKAHLVNQVVRGVFNGPEKQKMPFLDGVVRNLWNNESYRQPDTAKFMATVQRLMPAQAQKRPPPQAQKKA